MKNIIPTLAIVLLLIPVVAVRGEQFSSKDGVIFQFTPPGAGFVEKPQSQGYYDIHFEKGNFTELNHSETYVHHDWLPENMTLQSYTNEHKLIDEFIDCGVMNGSSTCKATNEGTYPTSDFVHTTYFIQNKHIVFQLSSGTHNN